MLIKEILNELKICHYTYDKKSGVIKASINTNSESNEFSKIKTALNTYSIIYTIDKNQNIQIEE